MQILELKKSRDELLRVAKKEKSEEYKAGYFDGVLDFYNKMNTRETPKKEKE